MPTTQSFLNRARGWFAPKPVAPTTIVSVIRDQSDWAIVPDDYQVSGVRVYRVTLDAETVKRYRSMFTAWWAIQAVIDAAPKSYHQPRRAKVEIPDLEDVK